MVFMCPPFRREQKDETDRLSHPSAPGRATSPAGRERSSVTTARLAPRGTKAAVCCADASALPLPPAPRSGGRSRANRSSGRPQSSPDSSARLERCASRQSRSRRLRNRWAQAGNRNTLTSSMRAISTQWGDSPPAATKNSVQSIWGPSLSAIVRIAKTSTASPSTLATVLAGGAVMIQVIAGARSQRPWGPLADERTPLEPFPAAAYRAVSTCFGPRRSRCSGGGHVVRIPASGSSNRFSNAEIRHRLPYRFLLVESASSCDKVSGAYEADFLHRLAARGAPLAFDEDVPSGHKSASEASQQGHSPSLSPPTVQLPFQLPFRSAIGPVSGENRPYKYSLQSRLSSAIGPESEEFSNAPVDPDGRRRRSRRQVGPRRANDRAPGTGDEASAPRVTVKLK